MTKDKTEANRVKETDKLSLFVSERHEDLAAMAGAALVMVLVLTFL